MNTLQHNGVAITLLAVAGLGHQQSRGDNFAITPVETGALCVFIGVSCVTGIV